MIDFLKRLIWTKEVGIKTLAGAFCCYFLSISSVNAFIISDIEIKGLQRVSVSNVFNALPVKVGDDVQSDDIANIARTIFKINDFKDVKIARDGNVLIVRVIERPAISKIDIQGNKKIPTKSLRRGLLSQKLVEGNIFQESTLERIRFGLEKEYHSTGRYSAEIVSKVIALPKNRVKIVIKINEGEVMTIKNINIIGNKVYSKADLLKLFSLEQKKWYSALKFWDRSTQYVRQVLEADLQNLRAFYMNSGYVNFNVKSSQVSISSDQKGIFITVNIEEGVRYKVNTVKFLGESEFSSEQLKKFVRIKEGQFFSQSLIQQTENNVTYFLGNKGYYFANIRGVPKIDKKNKKVDIVFLIDAKQPVYVRNIYVKGFSNTSDEVYRREIRQMEGALSNKQSIEQSTDRIRRLMFVKNVVVAAHPVAGINNQIDLDYTITEQPAGGFNTMIGYSSSGFSGGFSISRKNFLGTGNSVDLSLNKSKRKQSYRFSYDNPYYTIDGVSRGFDIYYSSEKRDSSLDNQDNTEKNVTEDPASIYSDYTAKNIGGAVNFSYPISEFQSVGFSFGLSKKIINYNIQSSEYIKDYFKSEGTNFKDVALVFQWTNSTVNRGFLPDRGYSQQLKLSVKAPGSTIHSYNIDYYAQYFKPISDKFTVRFSGKIGYLGIYGDTKRLPVFENYFAGGVGSVRGFVDNSLGSRVNQNGVFSYLGGNMLVSGSVELLFPLPFIEDQSRIRAATFFDFGNVFNTSCLPSVDQKKYHISNCSKFDFNEFRYSIGVGVTFLTPIGSMSISYANPIYAKEDDEKKYFRITLGSF